MNLDFTDGIPQELHLIPQDLDLTGATGTFVLRDKAGLALYPESGDGVSVVNLTLTADLSYPDGTVIAAGTEVQALFVAPDLSGLSLADPDNLQEQQYRYGIKINNGCSLQGYWTVWPDSGPARCNQAVIGIGSGPVQLAVSICGVFQGTGGGGDVLSVFGRTGAVTAQTGDYTADQVGADDAGSAAAVQSDLDNQKPDIAANSSSRHTHANKSVLDDTTASYTPEEKNKLSSLRTNSTGHVRAINASASLAATDDICHVTAPDSNVILTLPPVADCWDGENSISSVIIINRPDNDNNTYSVTVDGTGSEEIDGALTDDLFPGESLIIYTNGVAWFSY